MEIPVLLFFQFVLLQPAEAVGDGIHELSDGSRLEGRARVGPDRVRLETPFGTRIVRRSDYRGRKQVDLDELKRWYTSEADRIKTGDLPAHRSLAERCRVRGYQTGLRRQLNVILRTETDDRWARQVVEKLASVYAVHRNEHVRSGRELRRYIDFLFEILARRDNCGAVTAAVKANDVPTKLVFGPAMKALKSDKPRVRWLGAHVLRDHTGSASRIRELYRRSLSDGVWAVRRECVRSLKVSGDTSLSALYARQLSNPKQMLRVRAAQALGELGIGDAARPLVRALAGTWRPSRAYVASTRQIAYVKDYDVEVAQTAFIADPVVDILQEGSVLEVSVLSIGVVRRVYRDALRKLTGADFGVDAARWKAYLETGN